MSWFFETFHNASLWPLLLLAFLPLLLHILDRRRARRVDWPAMRFYLFRDRKVWRRIRFREAILIAVRTGALVTLLLAFLRPQWSHKIATSERAAGRQGLVILIDTSYSMAYTDRGQRDNRFELARASAFEFLNRCREDDIVYVVTDLNPTDRLTEKSSYDQVDPVRARELIGKARLGEGSFATQRAIGTGIRLASELPTATRRIVLLSDLQGLGTGDGDRAWKIFQHRAAQLSPRPRITIVDCGSGETANGYVQGLRSADLIAGTDQPVDIVCDVGRSGAESESTLQVYVDGESVFEKTLHTGEGPERIRFAHSFRDSGIKQVRAVFRTKGSSYDGLDLDDEAYLLLKVQQRLEVVLVEHLVGGRLSGEYIAGAIWPASPGMKEPTTILRVRRVSRLPEELGSAGVVVLAGLPEMSAEDADRLENFVRSGRGLLIFASPVAVDALSRELLFRGGSGVLPGRLVRRVRAPLNPVLVGSHPALNAFQAPQEGDLGVIEVYSYWETEVPPRTAGVIAELSSGAPWIVEKTYGEGRVLLVSTSGDPNDSDLPETTLFPPFIHQLVRYVGARHYERPGGLLGEPMSWLLPSPAENVPVTVEYPTGMRRSIPPTRVNGRWLASSESPQTPGFCRLERLTSTSSYEKRRAINFPPRESHFRRRDGEHWEAMVSALQVEVLRSPEDVRQHHEDVPVTIEYWPFALCLSLALFLCELVAHGSFSARPETQGARSFSRYVSVPTSRDTAAVGREPRESGH